MTWPLPLFGPQERELELQKEQRRQEENDKLRQEFAQHANAFHQWIQETRWQPLATVQALGLWSPALSPWASSFRARELCVKPEGMRRARKEGLEVRPGLAAAAGGRWSCVLKSGWPGSGGTAAEGTVGTDVLGLFFFFLSPLSLTSQLLLSGHHLVFGCLDPISTERISSMG